VLNKI